METKIKTMNELADIINACDDYPNTIVDAAIKANGWKDEQVRRHYSERRRNRRMAERLGKK